MKTYLNILEENRAFAEETFTKIDKKLTAMTERSWDKLPDGVDENGMHVEKSVTWWTNGFWGGLNHLMYDYTKKECYLKTALRSEEKLDEALLKFDELHHDVGFMWHILSGANYRLRGDRGSRTRNLYVAATLASRYVLEGDFIRAWNAWGSDPKQNYNLSIIDCLMNLPLLYWASEQVRDDRFTRIAMAHADMAMRDHLRPDGSVNHIVEHDRDTGAFVAAHGGQGMAPDSCWSRGAAWALYGFTLSYMHTGEERYLTAAKQVANYFIANVCDDWLPRVDFRAPAEPVMYDSSAGACAACGLIELAKLLPENEGGAYMHAAVQMMRAMTEKFCNWDENNDHMLDYGTVRYPVNGDWKAAQVHVSIIYSDYFFTEAILKLLGYEFNPWMK